MKLTLSPTMGLPGAPETTIHVQGDVLTIDGTPYDLSPVPEGGEASAEGTPISGKIVRVDGVIHATVQVILGDTASSVQPSEPWVIENASGDVAIPANRLPPPETDEEPEA